MGYGNRSYGKTTYGQGSSGAYIAAPVTNIATQTVAFQIDVNIGLPTTPEKNAAFQIDENIGLLTMLEKNVSFQIDEAMQVLVAQTGYKFIRLIRRNV